MRTSNKIDCDNSAVVFDESLVACWPSTSKEPSPGAVANPDSTFDGLPLRSAVETASLLKSWNPRPTDSSVKATIHQIIERQASLAPDAVALVFGEARMSYRELNESSNQLARKLRTLGVSPDSLVAVCFERSLEMIVSFLAVLKAGGAYLPVDPSYPKERLQMIFDDAQPRVLLTQERLLTCLCNPSAQVLCVDRDWTVVECESRNNLEPTSKPENLAYVIYTSGSTGKPKGVMVTHANVVRLMASTEGWFHFNRSDVWTMFHSCAFDFSVWEIWGSLMTGGSLVIVPFWVSRSPRDFYNLLSRRKVTVLNQTPAAFYQIIQVEESGYAQPLSLRYVIFGGEALNFANLRPWFERHADQQPRLVNMYGITETTVHVTYRLLTGSDGDAETRSLIGEPIPDLRLYLLDGKMSPVPPGVEGEIYVGGAGVARGYLNRPELSAERFVTDPFSDIPGARMYRSGDLARFFESGELEYLGRGDDQVKIRGFRIELGEIEAALVRHPAIRQACVIAKADEGGNKRLVAYYVPADSQSLQARKLRDFLSIKLPAFMVPSLYTPLAALPLNLNGKVDRAALPAPEAQKAKEMQQELTSNLEQMIAEVWKTVLHQESVGLDDSFFDLGGDSLLIVAVHSRLQELLNREIEIMDLFEFTTIRTFSQHLENSGAPTPTFSSVQQQAQRQREAFASWRIGKGGTA